MASTKRAAPVSEPKPTRKSPGKRSRPGEGKGRQALLAQPLPEIAPESVDGEPEVEPEVEPVAGDVIRVRRLHRRDLKRVWEFLKRVFRDVNQKTVELQRPRSRRSFEESYDNEGIEQLVFEHGNHIVGYAECTYEVTGADNWVNWRWFDARDMRPIFVEELAVDPDYQGRGVGSFMLEQLRHSGSLRGCTHIVLEVAENNEEALQFYRKRNFQKIDAAIFLAQRIDRQPQLLPPRPLKPARPEPSVADKAAARAEKRAAKAAKQAAKSDEGPARKPKKASPSR